ncbi:Sodium-dependent glucose transporter 1 [Collichthys lucidus]|uniref:Sodium-dependent glucose transporter 1 n=1 Tax=Collichthys lucidus TaxID=240159 RepID=A0A4U5ULN8_COLLU|nr:Sodium-dependent glucose transporter 1 [Collichthys lucidus]
MSSSAARDAVVKKKHVRFASMEDDDDNDDQEEDTLFDKRKDTGRGLKSALKAVKRSTKAAYADRVEVVAGGRGGYGACGRWMVTLALCGSFLGLGMSISVLGPTFEDLALNVKKNISNISYIFVGRSAGYIGGSLIGGILFECMNPHLLLGFSMLVTAFGMCAIPFCKQALLLTVLMSSIGMCMGVLDTGGNVLILNTWGEQAGPHMQALHFSFAAGAFVSPIIAKLLFGPDGNGSITPTNSTLPVTTEPISPDVHTMSRYIHSRSSTLKSMWAYIVISSFVFLVSLLFFFLFFRGSFSRDKARTSAGKPLVAKHHMALVALLFFFFFGYVGAEVAYGSFIYTFAKDYAHMDQSQAAGLNSLFWGTFAACRGLAIFFAACMYPGTMILLCLVGSTVSSLFLCLFSKEKVALWVCTGLYGASMATTFPSGISWLEQYTTVTGHTAAAFVVGAALGEMVLPVLIGFLLGQFPDQPLLMYLSLITATFTSILFPVMYKLASAPTGPSRKPRARGRPDADDSEYRQALLASGANDEEEEEEQDNEADQWNDADFEVIEMDDTPSLISSPSKASSPQRGSSAASNAQATEPAGGTSFSDIISLVGDSPRRKLLLSLEREKRD